MQLEAVRRKTGETIRRYGYAMKRVGATALLGASVFVSGCATAVTRGGNETKHLHLPQPQTLLRRGHRRDTPKLSNLVLTPLIIIRTLAVKAGIYR